MTAAEVLTASAESLRAAFDASFANVPDPVDPHQEELLAIAIDADAYAMRIADVTGLHRDRKIVPVPSSVSSLLGIASFRGVLVPVYDLRALLGYAPSTQARWTVVARSARAIAFAFDRCDGSIRAAATPASTAGTRPDVSRHVLGLVVGAGVRRVLDVGSLVRSIASSAPAGVAKER